MNKIEELIAELCPEGVEFKALKDVALVSRGKRLTKRQLDPSGRFPVYSGGVTPMGYYGENNQSANTVAIVKYGTAGFVNYITSDFWANDVCYCIKPFERIQGKYLYYALKSRQDIIYSLAIDAIPAHLPTEVIKNFRIPIPPLEVQHEIVNILDTFSALVAELEAELEAEMEARKKQYQYYRDRLLSFNTGIPTGISRIDEVELRDLLNYEQPGKYLVEIAEYDDEFPTPVLTAGKTFILGYTSEENGIYPASSDEPVIIFDDFTATFKWVNFPFKAKSSAMKILTLKTDSRENFRYIYYAMNMIRYRPQDHARQWIKKYSKFRIPVPPLEIQNETVSILDKFDALVNDLSIGLPAEIKARRKQYEYYRDRLLTFKEAA